jgi:hypothetical protein
VVVIKANRISDDKQTVFISYWNKQGFSSIQFAHKFLTVNEARRVIEQLKTWRYAMYFKFEIKELIECTT